MYLLNLTDFFFFVQTYMMMIGASVGDLVQFVKKGASGREGVRKRKGALGNRAGVNQVGCNSDDGGDDAFDGDY